MKLKALVLVASTFLVFSSNAQKLSKAFKPVIKEAPTYINVAQESENYFLIYGDFDYYDDEITPSLIRVDKNGVKSNTLKKIFLDKPINSLKVLSSGKILVQGEFLHMNGNPVGNMLLLNPDGSEDNSFAIDKNLRITSFQVQSSGKIVIASKSSDGDFFSLSRLNPDGSLDQSFSTNSALFTSLLKIADNDQLYYCSYGDIIRLTSDGAVDNAFSYEPKIQNSSFNNYTVLPNNTILASLTNYPETPPFTPYHELIKILGDGKVDAHFIAPETDQPISEINHRRNGQIIVAGFLTRLAGEYGNAFELNEDGSFSKTLFIGNTNYISKIIEDVQENIYLTGTFSSSNYGNSKYILKLNKDYKKDEDFGLSLTKSGGASWWAPFGIQRDGKLIFAGDFTFDGFENPGSKFGRYNSDGTVDNTFAPTDVRPNSAIRAIQIQDDGKILLGGEFIFSSLSPVFGRLLPNGKVDYSFVTGRGIQNSKGFARVSSIRVENQKIYVAGSFDHYNDHFSQGIVVLDLNGNPLTTFKGNLPKYSEIQDMEIQSSGKIILMGTFPFDDPVVGTKDFVRINEDGSIDQDFNLSLLSHRADFEIDSKDNIIVVGENIFSNDEVIKRFNSEGEVDIEFDLTGKFETDRPFPSLYSIKAVSNGMYAVSGQFKSFSGVPTPGIVLIDSLGKIVPFENPFENNSYALRMEYSNNMLIAMGTFTSNHRQDFSSCIKIVFPIENSITAFKATALSDSKINISWNGQLKGADFVEIEQKKSSGNFEVIATIPNDSNSVIAEGLEEATIYHYSIMGYNEFYSSICAHSSDTTFIKPQIALAPTDITYSSFVANWEYLPGTDSCLLQVSKDNFVTFTTSVLKEESLLVEVDDSVANYKYRVQRFRSGMVSKFSDEIEVKLLVLGIEERNLKLKIYPNPSPDYILIDGAQDLQINLYSANGTLVREEKLKSRDSHHVDIRNLPAGVYILILTDSNNKVNRYKIIKEN